MLPGGRLRGYEVSGMANSFNNPLYWRERAAEARTMAENFTDEKARKQIIEVAERYDRLAKMAEIQILGKEPKR
jgi:hypothetical protein